MGLVESWDAPQDSRKTVLQIILLNRVNDLDLSLCFLDSKDSFYESELKSYLLVSKFTLKSLFWWNELHQIENTSNCQLFLIHINFLYLTFLFWSTIVVWYLVSELDHSETFRQMSNENSDLEIPEANIKLYKVVHSDHVKVKLWSIAMIDESSS